MKKVRTISLYILTAVSLFFFASLLAGNAAFAGTFPSEKPIYEGGGESVVPVCDIGEVAWLVYFEGLTDPTDSGTCGISFDPDVSYFDLGGPPLPGEIVFCNEELSGTPYTCGDISNTVAFDLVCGTYTEGHCASGSGHVNIWGEGKNGFWGSDFTPFDIKDQVAASVQATGGNVYPLLIFVGIPLAFIIGLAVVNFIRQGVEPKKRFSSKKFNEKADELEEFYSRRSRAKAPEGTNWDKT